jgi:serine protease AprX
MRALTTARTVLLLSLLALAAPLSASAAPPPSRAHAWIAKADDAARLQATLKQHRAKLDRNFERRLAYASKTGRVRVMGTVTRRTAQTERSIARTTGWVRWYGKLPAFYASVSPDQLGALLRSKAVRFVELDHKVKQNLAISALDVHARGVDGAPAGPVTGEKIVSLASPTATWTGDAPANLVSAANILIATVGPRVCEAPTCDTFELGVADAGRLSIATTAGDVDWVDMEVIGPDGAVRYRGGETTAPLVIEHATPGTYTVNVWVNAAGDSAPYEATATLSPSDAPPSVWSFDRSGGALGALASSVDGLSADAATGKGVTVAIIDGGIDKTHPDFGGFACQATTLTPCESRVRRAVVTDTVFTTPLGDPGDRSPTTDLAGGHGTHVAGIVGGNGYMARKAAGDDSALRPAVGVPMGIAPQASLLPIKNGELIWAGLSTGGLNWLAEHAKEYGVRVVNNSWGCVGGCAYDGKAATSLVLKALYDAGVVTVFAAGNDGGTDNGAALASNAGSPYTLGVANYDAANHLLNSGSSRGKAGEALPDPATWTPESEPVNGLRRPDLAAPGTNIISTRSLTGGAASLAPRVDSGDVAGAPVAEGTSGYVSMTGTSMAAPHVAGAAAVLFSACPSARPLDVMRAMMASADPTRVRDSDNTRVALPYEVGYGGLDVAGALGWMRANVAGC